LLVLLLAPTIVQAQETQDVPGIELTTLSCLVPPKSGEFNAGYILRFLRLDYCRRQKQN